MNTTLRKIIENRPERLEAPQRGGGGSRRINRVATGLARPIIYRFLLLAAFLLWHLPNVSAQIVPGAGTTAGGTTSGVTSMGESSIMGQAEPLPQYPEQYEYTGLVDDPSMYRWQIEGALQINGQEASNFQDGIVTDFDPIIIIEWDTLGIGSDSTGIGIIRVLKYNAENPEIPYQTLDTLMARWSWLPWNSGWSWCLCNDPHVIGPGVYSPNCSDDGNVTICPRSVVEYKFDKDGPRYQWIINYQTITGASYQETWEIQPGADTGEGRIEVTWYDRVPYENLDPNWIDWWTDPLNPPYQAPVVNSTKTISGAGWSSTATLKERIGNATAGDIIVEADLRVKAWSVGPCSRFQTQNINVNYSHAGNVANIALTEEFPVNCLDYPVVGATITPSGNVSTYEFEITNPGSGAVFAGIGNGQPSFSANSTYVSISISNLTSGTTAVHFRVRQVYTGGCNNATTYGAWKTKTIYINQNKQGVPPTAPQYTESGPVCKTPGSTPYNIYLPVPNSVYNDWYYFEETPSGDGSGATVTYFGSKNSTMQFNLQNVVGNGTVTIGHIVMERQFCFAWWFNPVKRPVTVTFPAVPTKPATPTFTGRGCTNPSTGNKYVSVPVVSGVQYNWYMTGNGHYFNFNQQQNIPNSYQDMPQVTLGSSDPLNVWVEYVGCGGVSQSSDVLTVPVNQTAPTPAITPITNTNFCKNQYQKFCVDAPVPGVTYEISLSSGGVPIDFTNWSWYRDGDCWYIRFQNYPQDLTVQFFAQACAGLAPSPEYNYSINWITGLNCPDMRMASPTEAADVDVTVKAYPNPAATEVTITWTEAFDKPTVRLYNSLGQLVSETRDITNKGRASLSLQSVAAGIYHAHVTDGKLMGSVTIVKQD